MVDNYEKLERVSKKRWSRVRCTCPQLWELSVIACAPINGVCSTLKVVGSQLGSKKRELLRVERHQAFLDQRIELTKR